jgi:hypothetical protein
VRLSSECTKCPRGQNCFRGTSVPSPVRSTDLVLLQLQPVFLRFIVQLVRLIYYAILASIPRLLVLLVDLELAILLEELGSLLEELDHLLEELGHLLEELGHLLEELSKNQHESETMSFFQCFKI